MGDHGRPVAAKRIGLLGWFATDAGRYAGHYYRYDEWVFGAQNLDREECLMFVDGVLEGVFSGGIWNIGTD